MNDGDVPHEVRATPRSPWASALRVIVSVTVLSCVVWTAWVLRLTWMSEALPEGFAAQRFREQVAKAARPPPRQPVAVPWPSHPGMRERIQNESDILGFKSMNEQCTIAAAKKTIIQYYRARMAARGWQDVSEEYFGINIQPGAGRRPPNLQNEAFLLKYERIINSQLALRRGDETVFISVADSDLAWKQEVSFRFMGAAPVTVRNRMQDRLLAGYRAMEPTAFLEQSQQLSDDAFHTRFFYQRKNPEDLFAGIVADLEREGWTTHESPVKSGNKDVLTALFRRGAGFAVLQVSPGPIRHEARAVLSVTSYDD